MDFSLKARKCILNWFSHIGLTYNLMFAAKWTLWIMLECGFSVNSTQKTIYGYKNIAAGKQKRSCLFSKVSCELHIILRSPHDKVSIFYMFGVNIRKQPLFEFNTIHVVCTVLLNGVANGVVTLFLHIISYDVNSLHVWKSVQSWFTMLST
jgi:hypothetical protein